VPGRNQVTHVCLRLQDEAHKRVSSKRIRSQPTRSIRRPSRSESGGIRQPVASTQRADAGNGSLAVRICSMLSTACIVLGVAEV